MAQTRRTLFTSVIAVIVTMSLTLGGALAAELLGTVKSVDADAKKIVVTEKDTDKDVEVTITGDTEYYATKKGETKKMDNFDLAKLKKGTALEITHEKAVASKITIKKGAPKKKEAN